MKSYEDCIRERFAAVGETLSSAEPEQALGDNSIARRFLEAAGRAEVERALGDAAKYQSMTQDQAAVEIIKERRGDAIDLVATAVATAATGLLGAGAGRVLPNKWMAALPGAALVLGGLVARQPYPVRVGLLTCGLSWLEGVRSQ